MDDHVTASALTLTSGDIHRAADTLLQRLGVQNLYRRKGLGAVVTTGSGRGILAELLGKRFRRLRCRSVTEITCHGTGAFFIYPGISMVVDIGGQDSKVIKMSALGTVDAFMMNDKCAAGTGRFFEVIADVLDLKMEQMVQMALRARSSVEITNTCAVFAESEIISHLAAGKSKAGILRGLHKSMADRIFALVRGLGLGKPMVMTGGVANNKAMVKALENRIGDKILVAPDPQLVGALGAAVMAQNMIEV